MKTKITGAVCIAVLIISFTTILTMAQAPSEPHNADAMWIEPSSLVFDTTNASVGQTFNITVWMNITENVFTYQIGLHYNRTQLKATRAGYTAGATSDYFKGHTTSSPPPVIDGGSLGNASVLGFESLLGSDFIQGPHSGSLMWTEFQILIVPTTGSLTSKFDISTEAVGGANTWVLDESLFNIAFTAYDASYSVGAAPPPPPKQLLVLISPPSASVSVKQTLLFTSNVTGGTPAYSYQWFMNGTVIPGATLATWTFSSTTNDTYTVYLNVTDSLGTTVKSNVASVTVVFRLQGDVNGDGKVDAQDILIAAKAFGSFTDSPRWNPDANLNNDGRVDGRDLVIIARNFGKGLNP